MRHTFYIIKKLSIVIFITLLSSFSIPSPVYKTTKGSIIFKSEAPLEVIKAASLDLIGLLDITKKSFSFSVNMNSFKGFNSPLQRIHFSENYVEAEQYPQASFKGKIIEDVDFTKNGIYQLRAKGIFTVHGVPQERIIKTTVTVNSNGINIQSSFAVLLNDHNIPIPKIVNQKLANSIKVEIKATLQQK